MMRLMEDICIRAGKPKYLAVKQRLAKDIRSGTIRDALPGEIALAKSLKVSRFTVRKALAELREEGFLDSCSGRNTLIRNVASEPGLPKILWVGRYSMEHDEPARSAIYNCFVEELSGLHIVPTYWMFRGAENEDWLMTHLNEYDGVVLADIGTDDMSPAMVQKFREFGNIVGTQERTDNLARVVCCSDDTNIGWQAAEYLTRRGIKRIGVIGVSLGIGAYSFQERVNGFTGFCMQNCPQSINFYLALSSAAADFDRPDNLLQSLRLRENRIQALFVLTDFYALRCLDSLQRLGFRVPEEIGILGCDNIPGGARAAVPISTLAHQSREIARAVWQTLNLNRGCTATGGVPEIIKVAPVLIARNSVA